MTTPLTASVLAQVAAAQARIAGMIVANTERANQGAAPVYDANDFFYEADNLDRLSVEVRSQVE